MSQQSTPPAAAGQEQFSLNPIVMAGAISVLFLVVFFILMIHVCTRRFLQQSSRSFPMRHSIAFGSQNAAASVHIHTGLDMAAIALLPTFVYKPTSPVDDSEAGKFNQSVTQRSPDCAVCLSEFQENEKGRMLPSCKHKFHTECIDMWLSSHTTCPLCREEVVPVAETSLKSASTHEQQQQHDEGVGQGTMEASPSTTEGNPVVSSCSSLPLSRSLRMPSANASSQVTIDIPQIEGTFFVSASGPLSTKCTAEEEAGPSHPLKSPGFRASIKRMLSRQSSRQKSFSQDDYEGSPK